jgi:hypothetical protein
MKSPKFLLSLVFLAIFLTSCYSTRYERVRSDTSSQQTQSTTESEGFISKDQTKSLGAPPTRAEIPTTAQVSLNQADQSHSVAEAMDRKILRDANLTLEVAAPAEVQRKINSIAELAGGFVVTSESKQRQVGEGRTELEVNLVIRVPATQFGSTLDQIRSAGSRVIDEKISGQDVTEEFIDLEARIKTQKALELQFLEIMKQAHKVEDALEVQSQIAGVRTEIEKLEGRKRFLENRASLSTITVSLQSPATIAVNTTGFGRDIREAFADSVDVARAIVLFIIRLVIVMIPIFLLIILPGWFILRYFVRRARKIQLLRAPKAATVSDENIDPA